jgi:hypothetical protein
MQLSVEDSLKGETLLSIETETNRQDADLFVFVESYPEKFFELVRRLPAREQEQLVCYFIVGGTQSRLCGIWLTTQTLLSQRLRRAIRAFAAAVMFGTLQVPEEKMREILERQGMEWQTIASDGKTGEMRVRMSAVFARYMATRSFSDTARHFKVHRAGIRREMNSQAWTLSPDSAEDAPQDDPEAVALGAVLRILTEGADPKKQGRATRHQRKEVDVMMRDTDVLGLFRVDLNRRDADDIFVSGANR